MIDRGLETVIGDMTRDWMAALPALAACAHVDTNRLGYVGLSMGSRFGIPLAAELGFRLRCAVFGKFGLTQSPLLAAELGTSDLLRDATARSHAPVLMHAQWDDELFPRQGVLDLFDTFSSVDKMLVARTGSHSMSHHDDESTWRSFIADHLLR